MIQVHKEELQHLETKHGPLPSSTEDPLEGNNSENNETDSDVKIESEEIILTENGDNLTLNAENSAKDSENENSVVSKETGSVEAGKSQAADTGSLTPKKGKSKGDKTAKGDKSPNKALQRYHNLSDVLSEGSPIAKRLFSSGGEDVELLKQARKLLVRTGKVNCILEIYCNNP